MISKSANSGKVRQKLCHTLYVLLVTAILLLPGCISWFGNRSVEVPDQQIVTTGQMVVHADFPLSEDHQLIGELKSRRMDVCETLDLAPSNDPIHVYLFETPESFGLYIAKKYPGFPKRRAFFVETDTRLNVYAHWGEHVSEDLRHEVAHGYLHSMVTGLPLWLDEGLAEFFETPRSDDGLHIAHVQLLQRRMKEGRWRPNIQRLVKMRDMREMSQLDYAESWAWVHFFLRSTPARCLAFQKHIAAIRNAGQPVDILEMIGQLEEKPGESLKTHIQSL